MKTNIKNKFIAPLFFGSTLALAGCSKTASNLGLQKEAAQLEQDPELFTSSLQSEAGVETAPDNVLNNYVQKLKAVLRLTLKGEQSAKEEKEEALAHEILVEEVAQLVNLHLSSPNDTAKTEVVVHAYANIINHFKQVVQASERAETITKKVAAFFKIQLDNSKIQVDQIIGKQKIATLAQAIVASIKEVEGFQPAKIVNAVESSWNKVHDILDATEDTIVRQHATHLLKHIKFLLADTNKAAIRIEHLQKIVLPYMQSFAQAAEDATDFKSKMHEAILKFDQWLETTKSYYGNTVAPIFSQAVTKVAEVSKYGFTKTADGVVYAAPYVYQGATKVAEFGKYGVTKIAQGVVSYVIPAVSKVATKAVAVGAYALPKFWEFTKDVAYFAWTGNAVSTHAEDKSV